MYVLKCFRILTARCGSVVERERERDWITKGPGSSPGLGFSFFLTETLSNTGQKVSKCLRNGSDRLRKGQLRRRFVSEAPYSQLRS